MLVPFVASGGVVFGGLSRNVKPGDARPRTCRGHWAGAPALTALYTSPGQYITTWRTTRSAGWVQGDLNADSGRPVKARVRQARVIRSYLINASGDRSRA